MVKIIIPDRIFHWMEMSQMVVRELFTEMKGKGLLQVGNPGHVRQHIVTLYVDIILYYVVYV